MDKSLSQMIEELDDSDGATVTLSNGSGTYSLGGTLTNSAYAYPNTVINGGAVTGALSSTYPYPYTGGQSTVTIGAGSPYTITSGTGISNPWATSAAPKIRLDGEGADIEVNGLSLMDMIGKIEERLNILHPNEKLETEWEELRALGEQYRKLEQHIKDKQATWDKLKAVPPPAIE